MLHRLENAEAGIHGHSIEFILTALKALKESGAKFVSLRTLVAAWRSSAKIDPDWVAFTIDDGFADQAYMVNEAFVPMQCPVTIFLISDFLDRRCWPWDDQLAFVFRTTKTSVPEVHVGEQRFDVRFSTLRDRAVSLDRVRDYCKIQRALNPYEVAQKLATQLGVELPQQPPEAYRAISWDAARALERTGLVEFGPHSVTHRIVATLSESEVRNELSMSWKRLRDELNAPLAIFAWPTGRSGDFEAKDIAIAQELGLQASVSSQAGYAYRRPVEPWQTLYQLPRFSFPNEVSTVLRYASWLERGRELIPV
ncbi:MAG TPA: polysaccharide deacetylase family protein [Steroidobacteraceae bacterium]|nr:polysaccharide deacetylase family protein [Steroidobacteraceae bacterium]